MTLKRLFPLAAYASLAGGVSYLLRDEFITDRAAGAIDGTLAEPGPGTRIVVDVGNNLTISGNDLICAGAAGGIPSLVESQTIQRVLGRMIKYAFKFSGSVQDARGAYLKSTSPNLGRVCSIRTGGSQFLNYNAPDPLSEFTVGYPIPIVGINYCAIVLRMIGGFYFIKTSGMWVLTWETLTGDNATVLYANALWNPSSSAFKIPFVSVPDLIWIPSPLAYDTFTRSNGALGNTETPGPDGQNSPVLAWTGATWTVNGNKAINTPSLTANEFIDPGLEAWTSPTDLTNYSETGTVNRESSIVHGGTYSAKLTSVGSAIYQHKGGQTPYTWHRTQYWLRATASGNKGNVYIPTFDYPHRDPGTTWIQYTDIGPLGNITIGDFYLQMKVGAGSIYFDDLSLQTFTLSELFATVNLSKTDILARVNITLSDSINVIPAGIVTRLDSTSNPQNFILAFLDNGLIPGPGCVAHLLKCVNGAYTTLIFASVTYLAGASLQITLDGTTVILHYNNNLVGTVQTINEPTINNNAIHGMFSTDPGDSLDNFAIWARGSGGEYNFLDGF